jgi:uncharacterized membrane protein (DUF4010 family)
MTPDLRHGAGDVFEIAVTLALTFVLGLEREEAGAHRHAGVVAGVRTSPVIGLLGHALGLLSPSSLLPAAVVFAVVGAFLLVGYWHKLQDEHIGVTSECTALVGYMVGVMVAYGRASAAVALTVATVLLLTSKGPLRRFAHRRMRSPPSSPNTRRSDRRHQDLVDRHGCRFGHAAEDEAPVSKFP